MQQQHHHPTDHMWPLKTKLCFECHRLLLPAQQPSYLQALNHIYKRQQETNTACLPLCLVDYKILLHPVFYLPSGFLERRRTYKQSCLHTRAAARRQIYHRKLFFSFSFHQHLYSFALMIFSFSLVNNENTETSTTAKLKGTQVNISLAVFLRHVYTSC